MDECSPEESKRNGEKQIDGQTHVAADCSNDVCMLVAAYYACGRPRTRSMYRTYSRKANRAASVGVEGYRCTKRATAS